MQKLNKKINIGILILAILAFIIIFFISKNQKIITTPSQQEVETPLLHKEGEQTNSPKYKTETSPLLNQGGVRGGNSNTEQIGSVTVLAGETTIHLQPNVIFYDALVRAKNAGNITFSGRTYTGLGFFVTDIGTLHSGNGKSLIYYINGKEASVGVSSYTLKDGDVIKWKLE